MDNGESSYRRYLGGDEDAFGEIVRAYFDNLVFFVNRYVRDMAAAEDIALDVFARLAVEKHRYDFRVSLKTYLFMLGRSRAVDHLRRRKRLPLAELTEAEQLPSEEPGLEELLLADERRRAVSGALEQLGEEMRLAVHLVYFEELSAEDAGKILKKNRKQVYNLLYRAKCALRAILGEEGEQLL